MARAIPQIVKKFENVSYEREVLGKDPVTEHDNPRLVSRKLDVNLYMTETEAHVVHALIALGLECARRAEQAKKDWHVTTRSGPDPWESWEFNSVKVPGTGGVVTGTEKREPARVVRKWNNIRTMGGGLREVLEDALVASAEIKNVEGGDSYSLDSPLDFAFTAHGFETSVTKEEELPPGCSILDEQAREVAAVKFVRETFSGGNKS